MSDQPPRLPERAGPGDRPFVLALASGKGGVGKTLLSVSLAAELAPAAPALLVELDLFNRGLCTLLPDGEPVARIAAPDLLPDAPWQVVRVRDGLFLLSGPELDGAALARLSAIDAAGLRPGLESLILAAARACGARHVVLDCHGGPDPASLAACLVAEIAILVAEPDRVSLHGSALFLHRLEVAANGNPHDVRLVYNRAEPGFSASALSRFYDAHLRAAFGVRELLAVLPHEPDLKGSDDSAAFFCQRHPRALLTRKLRVLLHDVLPATVPAPATVREIGSGTRRWRRFALGAPPWPLRPAPAAIALAGAAFLQILANQATPELHQLLVAVGIDERHRLQSIRRLSQDVGAGSLGLLFLWLILPVTCRMAGRMFESMSLHLRTGHRFIGGLVAVGHVAIWLPGIVMLAIAIGSIEAWEYGRDWTGWRDGTIPAGQVVYNRVFDSPDLAVLLAAASWLGYLALRITVAVRGIRQEPEPADSRALLALSLTLLAALGLSVGLSVAAILAPF